ncbi:MAG TPA: HEAT repeat domain-containing protein, partial [Acidimicrobiales bacterium]|nr:HEAT repeat domain-containing protein [Acidimicrobiales bacterium]
GAATPVEVRAALGDADPNVRRRACAATWAAGVEVTALCGLLDDPEPLVVEAACWSIGEGGEGGSPAIAGLIEVSSGHDDPLCREAAVAALGAIGDERGLPAILRATTDKPAIRRRAIIALAPFDGDEVDAALQRALTDRDWQVRQAAEDLLAD